MLYKVCTLFLAASSLLAADLSGEWEFAVAYLNETNTARVTLKMDAERLSGKLNEINLEGTVQGDDLVFTGRRGNEKYADFEGKQKGDRLDGTATRASGNKMTWSGKRAVAPPATPRVHNFAPTNFHRIFSDAVAPVLRIFPGDSVRTWTVDAGGVDSNNVRRSQGGNPQTGPFHVEGAMPGDMLVVKLDRLRLNRDSAGSGDRIVPSALTPGYVQRARYSNDFDANWVLDREKGLARLKRPTAHLTNYTVKLQPMLGCIAVAPPGHMAFRTGFLGSYGGNLDYNQIREGTTIYLPVYVPGALLFVGDGHAAQGDGELTGDALETSMHVEFTVNLVRGKSIAMPLAENDDYVMSLGIANSLPEALQTATSELALWLQNDYKLSPNEAAIVLGTAMQYNIAEVVDPLVHVVARIRKESLSGLK